MAFRLLDVDGSGKVSRKELRELLESNYTFNAEEEYKMNPKELDDMISSCDKNGDGEIDYDEFIKMMTLTGKWPANLISSIISSTYKYYRLVKIAQKSNPVFHYLYWILEEISNLHFNLYSSVCDTERTSLSSLPDCPPLYSAGRRQIWTGIVCPARAYAYKYWFPAFYWCRLYYLCVWEWTELTMVLKESLTSIESYFFWVWATIPVRVASCMFSWGLRVAEMSWFPA